MLDSVKFYELLPALKQKLVGSATDYYARSWFNPRAKLKKDDNGYKWDDKRKMSDTMWFQHFSQEPTHSVGLVWGSFALGGKYIDGEGHYIPWVTIDADTSEQTALIYDKLIPVLEHRNIPNLLEYGGDELERRKVWIFTGRCRPELASDLIDTVLAEAELDKSAFDGIYPTHSGKRSLLRIPGGYYPKRKRVFPVELNGQPTTKPFEIIQAILDCPIFDEKRIEHYLSQVNVKLPERKKKKERAELPDNFRWIALNLPLPVQDLPSAARVLCQQCPAYHHLINSTVNHNMIDEAGGLHHRAGVCLSALGQYIDKVTNSSDGEEWFDKTVDWYRGRSADSHNWKNNWGKHAYTWGCETMSDLLDKCGGCPHKVPGFENPSQLFHTDQLVGRKIADVFLTSPEWVRANTFPKVKEHIWKVLEEKRYDNILLKSFQGAGKSFLVDQLTADLVADGKTVIIAVPTAELAMERKRHLKQAFGVDAFALMSFTNLMEHIAEVDCPNYQNISEQLKLGVSSSRVKGEFCKGCKFKDACPYPKQYSRAKEESVRVLIIQHAHFSTQETLYHLLSRSFDVMFVDEVFVDSVFTDMKATQEEIALLETIGEQWTDTLANWFKNGGDARGKLEPDAIQRESVEGKFREAGIDCRVADFIRLYNLGLFYSTTTGAFKFHPLPVVPVRVFTDATPPEEMIEAIINKPLTVFGEGEVLDYSLYNERNKVVQVVDGSMSKSALAKDDYTLLIGYMEFIGYTCRKDHPNERILITTYQDQQKIAKDWLKENFPDVYERSTFNLMSVGTNAHVDKSVQFLLAGLYINARRMLKEAYRLKEIVNFWNRMDLRPEIKNIYPYWIEDPTEQVSIDKESRPVRKIHADGLYEYNLEYQVPRGYYYKLIHELDVGRTQQSIRLRFHTGIPITVYVIGNMFLPSFLIKEIRLQRQLVKD